VIVRTTQAARYCSFLAIANGKISGALHKGRFYKTTSSQLGMSPTLTINLEGLGYVQCLVCTTCLCHLSLCCKPGTEIAWRSSKRIKRFHVFHCTRLHSFLLKNGQTFRFTTRSKSNIQKQTKSGDSPYPGRA
jgi:hypothetical protein